MLLVVPEMWLTTSITLIIIKKNRICKIELHILKEKNAWMNLVFQLCKCVHQVTMLKNVFSSC